jgi:hypothetical protein
MERIDTNPEEFIGRSSTVTHMSRWGTLVDIALDINRSDTFITPEERAALVAKLAVVRGEYFHKEVLRKLMEDQSGGDSSDQMYGGGVAKALHESMRVQQALEKGHQALSQLGNLSSTVQVRRPYPGKLIT